MGLCISYPVGDDYKAAWRGAYGAFMTFRTKIAELAGLPPLQLMEGFFEPLVEGESSLGGGLPTLWHIPTGTKNEYSSAVMRINDLCPVKWECLKPSVLFLFLHHSDCKGEIQWECLKEMADLIEELIPLMPEEDHPGHIGNWAETTQKLVDGMREAFSLKVNLGFH